MVRFGYFDARSEYKYPGNDLGNTKSTDASGGLVVGPRLGVDLFFARNAALNLGVYFDYYSGSGKQENGRDIDYDTTRTDYGLAVGFDLFF